MLKKVAHGVFFIAGVGASYAPLIWADKTEIFWNQKIDPIFIPSDHSLFIAAFDTQ
jgi:hypothetical protein